MMTETSLVGHAPIAEEEVWRFIICFLLFYIFENKMIWSVVCFDENQNTSKNCL